MNPLPHDLPMTPMLADGSTSTITLRPEPEESGVRPLTPADTIEDEEAAYRLLRLASRYLRESALRQAIELYFDIMRGYGQTPSARTARQRLLEIADEFERVGMLRQARSIYERLD